MAVGDFPVKPQGGQAAGEAEAACLVVAVGEQGLVGFGAQNFQAELLLHLFHSESVVEVAVGEEDVFQPEVAVANEIHEVGHLLGPLHPGVDNGGLQRAGVPYNVGVLLEYVGDESAYFHAAGCLQGFVYQFLGGEELFGEPVGEGHFEGIGGAGAGDFLPQVSSL